MINIPLINVVVHYTIPYQMLLTAIDPCQGNSHGCHGNANCSYTGPGKHRCECAQGYKGDGMVCVGEFSSIR
jgi:hypothetical protein